MGHIITSPLSTFLSHKQNYIKGRDQQWVFYPKEKVQTIKKHVKRYSTSHNQENTNWNKILGFCSLHRPERRKRFLLTNVDKDLEKGILNVHGSAKWYRNLLSLPNFNIYHLRPRNSTSKHLSHRISYSITQRCMYKNVHQSLVH